MTEMNDKEKEQVLQQNPHLKKYIDTIKKKMNDPKLYSVLPYEARDQDYPNLIYAGQ